MPDTSILRGNLRMFEENDQTNTLFCVVWAGKKRLWPGIFFFDNQDNCVAAVCRPPCQWPTVIIDTPLFIFHYLTVVFPTMLSLPCRAIHVRPQNGAFPRRNHCPALFFLSMPIAPPE